jgi:hypothetical protein
MKKRTVYLAEDLKSALGRPATEKGARLSSCARRSDISHEDVAEAMAIVESFCELRSVAY